MLSYGEVGLLRPFFLTLLLSYVKFFQPEQGGVGSIDFFLLATSIVM